MGSSKRGDVDTTQALGTQGNISKLDKDSCCEASLEKMIEAFLLIKTMRKVVIKGLIITLILPLIKQRRILLNWMYGFFIHVCIMD
jgi:hypothetical protein